LTGLLHSGAFASVADRCIRTAVAAYSITPYLYEVIIRS